MDETLEDRLVALAARDQQVLQELFDTGELPTDGYHPRLRALHEDNARVLGAIIDRHGWPDRTMAGEKGAEAAWLVAQHAVFDLAFMQRCADLVEKAVTAGTVPGWQLGFLQDRLRTLSGRPQLYGTQFERDAEGRLVSSPIEDPAGVDARRAALGLNTLAERTAEMQARDAAARRPR